MQNNPHIYSIRKTNPKTRYRHETHHLTAHQVERIFSAAERAYESGVPLNRFITIHFDDYADRNNPQSFMVALMEHVRKWLKRRSLKTAYLYVIENAPIKGLHAHLMLHIPAGHQIAFKKAMRAWLPFEWSKKRVDVKRIDYPPFGALHALNPLYGRLRYICKGIDPKVTPRKIEPKHQGVIVGRRYGISRTLTSQLT